jgi:peptidyl-prolyl cis-trans isomerase D
MIKMLRKGAIEKPFILKVIMWLLAIVFVVGMGWGIGDFVQGAPEINVAEVNGAAISKAEYDRDYEQTYKLYRNLLQENFNEEMVKTFVIDNLVEKTLWIQAAQEMGLSLSLEELQNAIIHLPSFQNKGRFDPGLYRRVLSLNNLSPEAYEQNLRDELLIEKAKNTIRDAVVLTDSEIKETRASLENKMKNKSGALGEQALKEVKAVGDLLQQKRQRAILAYQENLKASSKISIQRKLL